MIDLINIYSDIRDCLVIDFFCLDSDNQSCGTDRDKDKANVTVILASGDSYVKTNRPSRQKVSPGASNRNEMPS